MRNNEGSKKEELEEFLAEQTKNALEKTLKGKASIFSVQIGRLKLRIVLEAEGQGVPKVKITVGGLFVGHINTGEENEKRNQGSFEVENMRRGNGSWAKKEIRVTPTGGFSSIYKTAVVTERFEAESNGEGLPEYTIYIEIRLKRHWYGAKKVDPDNRPKH